MRVTVVAFVVAVAAAGCGGSTVNKAGGSTHTSSRPLTLTLLTGDRLFAPEFAAAVERLSRGSLRIEIEVAGNQPAYEAKTVEAVRAGKAQLGSVGARVWDAFGVPSFRALLAPLLVDSLALEERVLDSPAATQMVHGIDRAGLVGLAVLPGPLRRPLGLSRPLVGPADYRRATIAIRFGGVARATLQTLGAKVTGYNIGRLPRVDGAELDLATIAGNGYDAEAKALTANVVLWPRPQTVFANRAAFDRLTTSQQDILRRAGREAIPPERARVEKDDRDALAAICTRGTVQLVTATAAQLSALRRAVRPVYRRLAHDPLTRSLMATIAAQRREASIPSADAICGRAAREPARSPLDGLWRVNAGFHDLVASGVPADAAERQRGGGTLELEAGHWIGRERGNGFVWHGSYTVRGDIVRFVTADCPRNERMCQRNSVAEYSWSVYGDRLSLALASGITSYWGLTAKPLARVRR